MVPEAIKRFKRIVTLVIFLFFIFPEAIFPQCKNQFVLNQTVSLKGVTNDIENYYQNLIIQDIAIASQQTFNEISLRFDYTIRYRTDRCKPGLLDIRVLPVAVKCFPLLYYGYDISDFIKPEKADLVFYLTRHDGFTTDSLIFFDVPIEKDSSLYTSLTAVTDSTDRNISVAFAGAVFHYTISSYEIFRDRILQIDGYYAASLLADSTLMWANNGILSETGNRAEMILRQAEMERIINYIRPEKFQSVYNGRMTDLNGLTSRYQDLVRRNNRMKAIIRYNHFEAATLSGIIKKNDLLKNYLDRFDHYHDLAYKTDFRFINFIDGLARPDFSNAGLFALQAAFNRHQDAPRHFDRKYCRFIVQGLIGRGGGFELSGNQPRALTYYESAYNLSKLMNLRDYQSTTIQLVVKMKNNIAASYLEISRKSALTENPSMAAQYFYDALDMFDDKDNAFPDATWLRDYEDWLFLNFESQVVKYIELKNYSKAILYLNEIQSHCHSSSSYTCPELFHEWMRMVRDGIYHDLLQKAQNLLTSDMQEAGQVFRQATEMRMRAGYRIEKDKSEEELESRFLQIRYDELIEKGQRNFDKEEYNDALYYFNKAYFQERDNILRPYPELFSHRQTAARHVTESVLSDGRLKAWAYDFEGADIDLDRVKMMLSEYRFTTSDTLSVQYKALDEYIHQNQCEKVFREYNDLMLNVKEAKEKNDFILALKRAEDAVNFSMANLNCRIRDDEAWYQKVLLELPADFQQKEKELEKLSEGPSYRYLMAFADLKNLYYHNRLLEQGVVFIPLYDRVIKSKDSLFLTGMLGHFIKLKELENALGILDRLRELGYPAGPLAYQQKTVGEALARRDVMNSDSVEPWKKLESYTGRDSWYRVFGQSYKVTWLQTTKWNSKYWPFIWKK